MNTKHVGFLHPGEMGIFLAETAKNSGNRVYWAVDRPEQEYMRPCC